jgi:hypothetical protein
MRGIDSSCVRVGSSQGRSGVMEDINRPLEADSMKVMRFSQHFVLG